MGNKLQQLWTESLESNHQTYSTLHLNGIPALALFLSYLSFQAPGLSELSSSNPLQGKYDSQFVSPGSLSIKQQGKMCILGGCLQAWGVS